MTGTMKAITRIALPKIPLDHRAGNTAFFGAGPGTVVPGTFVFRAAAGTTQATGAAAAGSGVRGKWLILNTFSFFLDIFFRGPRLCPGEDSSVAQALLLPVRLAHSQEWLCHR